MDALPGVPLPAALDDALRGVLDGAELIPWPTPSTGIDRRLAWWPDGRRLTVEAAVGADAVARLDGARERLGWLDGRAPVPRVHTWLPPSTAEPAAALVTEPPPGSPATEVVHHVEVDALIASLAQGLRSWHDLDPIDCPFDARTDALVEHAGARVAAGLVSQDDLSPPYRRYTPERLLELLRDARPEGVDDLVLTHGRYGLGAVHLDQGRVVGYVDVDRAGAGDRYVDLAHVARDLAARISPEALGPFFLEYGIELPDVRRIDFHVLLDELR